MNKKSKKDSKQGNKQARKNSHRERKQETENPSYMYKQVSHFQQAYLNK